MKTRIRVGLIVSSPKIYGWQCFILEKLSSDARFEFSLVIQLDARPAGKGDIHRTGRFVDQLERKLSQRLFHRGLERNGVCVDERTIPPSACMNTDWLKAESIISGDGTQRVSDACIAEVAAKGLDVIINFGSASIGGGLTSAAKNGVWSFGFVDDRLGPPGFWDFYHHEPVSRAALQRCHGDVEVVVGTRAYRTFRFSWNENRRRLLWKSAWLLIDSLVGLADTGAMPAREKRDDEPPDGRPARGPGFADYCAAAAKVLWRGFVQFTHVFLFDQQWRIYVSEGRPENLDVGTLRSIRPMPASLMADPFPIIRNGRRYIFFEELQFSEGKGVISFLELPPKINGSSKYIEASAKRIIDTPYHLSYPFLFEFDDRTFMIPESSHNRTIELWECDSFPNVWHKRKNLFEDISAADTTLLRWNDRWWMFANIDRSNSGDHMAELHVFHSDHPIEGEWRPHPGNPVVADARRARMAGGFIMTKDGRLIRCCQKLGLFYGKAVILCEVIEFSETAYREVQIEQIEPDWHPDLRRTHHLAARDGLLALDGCHNSWKVKRYLGFGSRENM